MFQLSLQSFMFEAVSYFQACLFSFDKATVRFLFGILSTVMIHFLSFFFVFCSHSWFEPAGSSTWKPCVARCCSAVGFWPPTLSGQSPPSDLWNLSKLMVLHWFQIRLVFSHLCGILRVFPLHRRKSRAFCAYHEFLRS